MNTAESINKIPIRLNDERWFHIIENHNDLAGYYDEVLITVELLDFVVKGYKDALIAVRKIKNKYLAVIYKELSQNDRLVITAYFTSEIKKEAII